MREIMNMYKFSYTILKVLAYTIDPSLMTTSHYIYYGNKKKTNIIQINDKETKTRLQYGNEFYTLLCLGLNEGPEL